MLSIPRRFIKFRRTCKLLKIKFEITEPELAQFYDKNCVVCGHSPYMFMQLRLIDGTKPFRSDNLEPICLDCTANMS